jgi:autotransporter-associated beta strand protein
LGGSNTGDNSFAPQIGDGPQTTNFTKNGVGKWIVAGTNTYTGATLVNGAGGTLLAGSASAFGASTNALVVQNRSGRGVVALKGIDTTGDQISVTRVADRCIRETRAISENFIGRLNTDDARTALKQQLVATFLQMQRDGALVLSTDGKDPAFVVDVYSTQLDFAQGIVRIDIAVRPVRAIDYVYATIRVRN